MSSLGDWAAIGGAVAGGVGALGTWAAAIAALRTTRSADETAKRAARALGRTARPDVFAMLQTPDTRFHPTTDPAEGKVVVRNRDTRFAATNVKIAFLRADGGPAIRTDFKPIPYLEPRSRQDLGKVSIPKPFGVDWSALDEGAVCHLVVRFEDATHLVSWERYCGSWVAQAPIVDTLSPTASFDRVDFEPVELVDGKPVMSIKDQRDHDHGPLR